MSDISRTQVEVEIAEAVKFIRSKIPLGWKPEIGIVCGSGLGSLGSGIKVEATVNYENIPHFPVSSVQGHGKALLFGELGGKKVVAMTGRFHFYEGIHPAKVAYGVRTLAALGAKVLIVTNAAGGVNSSFEKNDIMVMEDHISFPCLSGLHPLVGHNDGLFGPRFPAVTNAYSPALRELVDSIAAEHGREFTSRLRKGTYVNVSGPSYETRHEIGMMRMIGGDAVGMSTVFEVIAAAHCGMQVLGLSLITNKCVAPGDVSTVAPSHAEVLEASNDNTSKHIMTQLVTQVCARADTASIPVTEAAVAYADADAIIKQASKQASASASTPTPLTVQEAGKQFLWGFGACLAVSAGITAANILLVQLRKSLSK